MFSVIRFESRQAWANAQKRRRYFTDGSVARLFLLEAANGLASQFRMKNFHLVMKLRLRQDGTPFYVRTNSSDLDAIRLIFGEHEYQPLDVADTIHTIVDLGANAGFSSLYFLNRFPKARIVSVEPDPRNVAMCRRNLQPYGDRATVLEGAIWSGRKELRLKPGIYRDGREWATQVTAAAQAEEGTRVDAFDMRYILSLVPNGFVDLLKIDIERSELELFAGIDLDWLDSVKNIAIELHDDECEAVFFRALKNYAFSSSRSGELTIITGLSRMSAETAVLEKARTL